MRKHIMIIVVLIVLLLSFVSCSKQVEDVEGNHTPDITDESPVQQTQEVSEPTPTPKPTLSEEEIRVIEKYNELIGYCKYYNDWSAAVFVKGMYDYGAISEADFYELASIPGFEDIGEFSDEAWKRIAKHTETLSLILNGKLEELDDEGMEDFYQSLCDASQKGTVYINAFDSMEKQERVIKGVALINKWLDDPTQENFELVKEVYFSEDLTPGEIILLYCHMYYSNGEVIEDKQEFLDNQGIKEYADEAYNNLLELNNKTN